MRVGNRMPNPLPAEATAEKLSSTYWAFPYDSRETNIRDSTTPLQINQRLHHGMPHPIDYPVTTLHVAALPPQGTSASSCRWSRYLTISFKLKRSFKVSVQAFALLKAVMFLDDLGFKT